MIWLQPVRRTERSSNLGQVVPKVGPVQRVRGCPRVLRRRIAVGKVAPKVRSEAEDDRRFGTSQSEGPSEAKRSENLLSGPKVLI